VCAPETTHCSIHSLLRRTLAQSSSVGSMLPSPEVVKGIVVIIRSVGVTLTGVSLRLLHHGGGRSCQERFRKIKVTPPQPG